MEPDDSQEQGPISLSLTHDQALVLFDWLVREDDREALPTEHPGEQRVLWALEAQLETRLVEQFQPDYSLKVQAARERLVNG